MDPALANIFQKTIQEDQRLTVLTGAGISAESGIPTFRGPEGYWTVGSKEYHPQEMATRPDLKTDQILDPYDGLWHHTP